MPTPLTKPQSVESAAEQIADLMDQLSSKDTLVMQLTERLEQAAEQLDRLHRSGADKRHGGSGGGSSGVLEPLTTKLDEALEAWNQTGPQFDYIVQRLDEIAGAIQGGHFSPADAKPGAKSGAPSPSHAPAPAGAQGGSFWDKMKSSMLDGTPAPAPAAQAAAASSAPAGAQATDESTVSETPAFDLSERISAPAPVVIDIEAATIEELREAVTTRDNYITALISELRNVEPIPELPADLASSGMVPEELVASLRHLEDRLKSKMLREELDLSLERARIARERVKLDQVKAQLESQIRRLSSGGDAGASSSGASGSGAEDPATGKLSWLKRLKGAK